MGKMKKLVIAVIISAVASFGLVGCSAVDTAAIAKKLKENRAESKFRDSLGQRGSIARSNYIRLSPEEKVKFKTLREWVQTPTVQKSLGEMTHEQRQTFGSRKTLDGKRAFIAEVSALNSPEGIAKRKEAERLLQEEGKKYMSKLAGITKKHKVTCTNGMWNTSLNLNKLVNIYVDINDGKGRKNINTNIRAVMVFLGKNHGQTNQFIKPISANQKTIRVWHEVCKSFDGNSGDKYVDSAQALSALMVYIAKYL